MSDVDRVLAALADGEQSVTELAVSSGLPIGRVTDALLVLSMADAVRSQVDQGTKVWRRA